MGTERYAVESRRRLGGKMSKVLRFPSEFLWGTATSAYQIEGSPLADGAGPSIWHQFLHTRGMAGNHVTGDLACDHYRRWREDVRLMRKLGMKAYRFSIAWARVMPEGRGAVNAPGLDFYKRLVDELLEADIEPIATLYHWDLPASLDYHGGWLNRDIAGWFADYATVMYRALDRRVRKWITLNEPWVIADGGYLCGAHAPGHRNCFEAPIVSHNLLRAHGAAVEAYRAVGVHEVGLAVNLEPKYPASPSETDATAVRLTDAYMNRQYLDPVFFGSYPTEMHEIFRESWPEWPVEDFNGICQPIDFLGVNYYTRSVTRYEPKNWPIKAAAVRQPHGIYTETDWEVFPQGMIDAILMVKERYNNLPMYIMENGAAFADPPRVQKGYFPDPLRISYLRAHIAAVWEAIEQGADVRGYMLWSFMDNLEWTLGFDKRFGIVHVDFETQTRTPKESAKFYSGVITTNCLTLPESTD